MRQEVQSLLNIPVCSLKDMIFKFVVRKKSYDLGYEKSVKICTNFIWDYSAPEIGISR